MRRDVATGQQWLRVGSTLLRFSVVGAVGVAVNSTVLYGLHGRMALPLVPASVLAAEVAIISNFLGNDWWTFEHGREAGRWRRLVKFNAVSVAGLGIATGTLWFLVTYGQVHYLLANVAGIGLATLWNFAVNLMWTWGRRGTDDELDPELEERAA